MKGKVKVKKLTAQQQYVLKLLFKFRFVSAGLLADVMGIRKPSIYQVLEQLVENRLVAKVYESSFRIDRKPAYYYLNKTGTTTVRKLMEVKESVVHTLYKNDAMTADFVNHCLTLIQCYVAIKKYLPAGSDVFSKTEINRFPQFPRTRPDMYVRTPEGHEAIVIIVEDKPQYIVRKRFEEILIHSEDEGWNRDYPHICFILKDTAAMSSFLHTTKKKIENMGIGDDELRVLAAPIAAFATPTSSPWSSFLKPKESTTLFS